jgi:hypothetical protein
MTIPILPRVFPNPVLILSRITSYDIPEPKAKKKEATNRARNGCKLKRAVSTTMSTTLMSNRIKDIPPIFFGERPK